MAGGRSRRAKVVGVSVLSGVVLGLAGCAAYLIQPGPGPEPGGVYLPLTTPIVAIGDTQEHLSTGYPLLENDSAVDAYVEVTQRPPEMPLFGRRVMEWALQRFPAEPYLHLGDVMDLSCRAEAERMSKIFSSAGRPGAVVPGNHDGLMFGIYSFNIFESAFDKDARKWNNACRRGAAPDDGKHKTALEAFTKRDFIQLYLREQAKDQVAAPGLEVGPKTGAHRVKWVNPNKTSYLSAIEANLLDGYRYADSFLVQRLRLPKAPGASRGVIVIGIDTNQAGPLVSTWDVLRGRSPGSQGHVRTDQIDVIERWVKEANQQGDLVVLAGHHHWRGLGVTSRLMLGRVMASIDNPLVYLSAHTHGGFWAEHRVASNRPLLELGVSSLSDWPIAYRRISFSFDARANRLLVQGDLMPPGENPHASFDDLLKAWERETCAGSPGGDEPGDLGDRTIVAQQRETRGTLMQWLIAALGGICEACNEPLYLHANAYQDGMLRTLLQADAALKARNVSIEPNTLPAWCAGQPFAACATALLAETASSYAEYTALFRRKAGLVAAVNSHLDDITDPVAKAYMTCRAVRAARIDYDLTDDKHKQHRLEAYRLAEQFFRLEASVGMR